MLVHHFRPIGINGLRVEKMYMRHALWNFAAFAIS